ncbi:MAG: EthD domain-containing protein [Acidimicrobiales bacterium]
MKPDPTPGTRMNYLITRRPTTSREELIAHWFGNHMPPVIAAQEAARAEGKPHARRYIATVFDPAPDDSPHTFDGVAQLWWDEPLPRPRAPHGDPPQDSFQERAEPYVPWPTTEYVFVPGDDRLPAAPNTIGRPFPSTRSGFAKVTILVAARDGADHAAFVDHWLTVHAANVCDVLDRVGGWRYVVAHSVEPGTDPFTGMAELYFDDLDGWSRFSAELEPDGMERWVARERTVYLTSGTEMIGIP